MTKNEETDISILRAHAIAAALKRAKPVPMGASALYSVEYDQWLKCIKQCAVVVCTSHGVSIGQFYRLCGEAG